MYLMFSASARGFDEISGRKVLMVKSELVKNFSVLLDKTPVKFSANENCCVWADFLVVGFCF